MGLNIRTKGQEGEREIARDLNQIVCEIYKELSLPAPEKDIVQRNQNQSAVGGCDLTGTYGLAIEIKRQETLSINPWWAQCVKSAQELNQRPVLIFRQNTPGGGRKLWRVILMVDVQIDGAGCHSCRAEISYEDFKTFFRSWAREHIQLEYKIGTIKPAPVALSPAPTLDLYA